MTEPRKKEGTKRKKKGSESEEKEEKLEEEKGVTESVLEGLSNVIPGLGGLVKGLEKSDAIQERLKEIDKEVEKRIRETPLKKTTATRTPHFKGRFEAVPSVRRKKEVLRDIPVDIFDEHKHIDVIAELPGIEEKDIKVDLSADILTISADRTRLKYFKKIKLPCKSKGIIKKLYKNGIMEIKIEKK
ncbi:MAG: heat shock protein [Candidatus Scalindua rubra]|uniref:Heat shock protein n=1 Tax=Candidatus Scalindua rubra TaxID=1872076 RepID=A0A1E3XD51_9BACT|nr:MAG: heat shock protein [Candidatus Scalindua rubra]